MVDTTKATETKWRLRDPAVGYVIAFVLSSVTLSMGYSVGVTPDTVGAFVSTQLGFWAGLMLIVWLASAVCGTGSVRHDYDIRSTGRDVAAGLALGSFVQLVVLPLLYVPIGLFVDQMDVSGEAEELLDRPGWTWLLLIGVVAVAPVIEELFFRGLLLNALRTRWGHCPAVIGSSLLFAGTHFQLLQLPGLFVAGLTFALMRTRTGRLGPAIWTHVGFNAASVAVLLLT